MNEKATLYYATPSPYSRKIRVLIRELGLLETVNEVAAHTTPIDPSDAVTAVNPLSKIPTLVLPDGTALYDSRVIAEYLLSQSGDARDSPTRGTPWPVLRRQALADGVLDAGILYRYELALRPKELQWPQWLDAQRGKIERGIAGLAADLPVASDVIGLDGVAIACTLGWVDFRMPFLAWRTRHPKLASFCDSIGRRPSMQETRPDA